jgi:predicted AAA+ superfamily ATPase
MLSASAADGLGALLENFMFQGLRRIDLDIDYYRTENTLLKAMPAWLWAV